MVTDTSGENAVVLSDVSMSDFVEADEYVGRMNSLSGIALADYDTTIDYGSSEETIDGSSWPSLTGWKLGVSIGAGSLLLVGLVVGAIFLFRR